MTAPQKRIEVIVKVDGSIIMKPQGFKGGRCLDATKNLEKAFGGPQKRRLTSEFSQREIEKAKTQQKNGG